MRYSDEDYATYGSLAHIENLFDFPASETFRRFEEHLRGKESPPRSPRKEAPPVKVGRQPDRVIIMQAASIESKKEKVKVSKKERKGFAVP